MQKYNIIFIFIIIILIIYLLNHNENFENTNIIFLKSYYNGLFLHVNSNGVLEFSINKYTPIIAPIGLASYPLEIYDPFQNSVINYNICADFSGIIKLIPTYEQIPDGCFQLFWNGQNILFNNKISNLYIIVNDNGKYYFTDKQYNSSNITLANI